MISRGLIVGCVAGVLAVTPVLGAVLPLQGGSITVLDQAVELPVLPAAGQITGAAKPHRDAALLVEARDASFDVHKIVVASLRVCARGPLCDVGIAPVGRAVIGDADRDRVPDLSVRLLATDVATLLGWAGRSRTLAVSAVLTDGWAVSGPVAVGPGWGCDDQAPDGAPPDPPIDDGGSTTSAPGGPSPIRIRWSCVGGAVAHTGAIAGGIVGRVGGARAESRRRGRSIRRPPPTATTDPTPPPTPEPAATPDPTPKPVAAPKPTPAPTPPPTASPAPESATEPPPSPPRRRPPRPSGGSGALRGSPRPSAVAERRGPAAR
ncbi:MAG: hypothetical protein U0838_06855 [Chloroflexota bacterium]